MRAFVAVALVLLLVCEAADVLPHASQPRTRVSTPLPEQLQAARLLVGRLLPRHADSFLFEALTVPKGAREAFEVEGLTIRASSGVAAAAALRFYLTRIARASVQWGRNRTGLNIDHLPQRLPPVPRVIRRKTSHAFRYYFNAVTFGYSSAWWTWDRYEQEIDWAALHGINLFLALEGQEYVWEKLWIEMGLTTEQLEKYFPGPAFLAWHRMGNLDGFAGPQPKDWRRKRYELQKQIVARMRSLGMIPVLAAFAGHIPEALEKLHLLRGTPIKVHRGSSKQEGWCGFEPTTLLDASDPLFRKIGKRFLQLQEEAYGTDHVYSCDTFNEMHVPFTDTESLRQSSKAVIDGMMEADPDAVWLMQGWLFLFSRFWYLNRIEAYLSGVPNDRMIVLDLFAEKRSLWDETKSFFGKSWIWCQLLNFGGNHGIYGNVTRVAVEPARAAKESPSFAGTGMSMESIERNCVLFEMLSDTVWTDDPLDIEEWLTMYVRSRYRFAEGVSEKSVLPAWKLLNSSVYHFNGQLVKPPIEERPRFYDTESWQPPRYAAKKVVAALRILVAAVDKKEVVVQGPFLQDLVDVTRQVLVDTFTDYLLFFETLLAMREVHRKSKGAQAALLTARDAMLGLCDDLDAVLESNINFMLGPQLEEATSEFGPETELQFRNILTLWGDGVVLNDYAAKQFSPMVREYYKKRWSMWLDKSISREQGYLKEVALFENRWFTESKKENTVSKGDSVELARAVLAKYAAPVSLEVYELRSQCVPVVASRLHQTWSHNLGMVQLLCAMSPNCGGFTVTGLIFQTNPTFESADSQQLKVDCYIKKSSTPEGKAALADAAADEKSIDTATVAITYGVTLLLGICAALVVAVYVIRFTMRMKKAQ